MFEVLWSNIDSVVYKLKAQQMKQPTVLLQRKQKDLFMSDFGSSDMCLFNYFCIQEVNFLKLSDLKPIYFQCRLNQNVWLIRVQS